MAHQRRITDEINTDTVGQNETSQETEYLVTTASNFPSSLEKKFITKLDEARLIALRMSESSAQREREMAVKVIEAQKTALNMARTAAERAQFLAKALNDANTAILAHVQALENRDREFAERLYQTQNETLARAIADGNLQKEKLQNQLSRAGKVIADIQDILIKAHTDKYTQIGNTEIAEAFGAPIDVRHLLTLRGQDFLVCAYRLLLHRNPDPRGLETYLDKLQSGTSTVEIVRQIRYSPEGKKIAADIRNIRWDICAAVLFNLPVIGSIFEGLAGLFRLFNVKREYRIFEHRVAQEIAELRDSNAKLNRLLLHIRQITAHSNIVNDHRDR